MSDQDTPAEDESTQAEEAQSSHHDQETSMTPDHTPDVSQNDHEVQASQANPELKPLSRDGKTWGMVKEFIEPVTAEKAYPAVLAYQKDINWLLGSRESLKLDWIAYKFDKAYHRLWQHQANQLFRRAVVLKRRYKAMKQKLS